MVGTLTTIGGSLKIKHHFRVQMQSPCYVRASGGLGWFFSGLGRAGPIFYPQKIGPGWAWAILYSSKTGPGQNGPSKKRPGPKWATFFWQLLFQSGPILSHF